MTLDEIIAAVEAGKTVCWSNGNYQVVPAGYYNPAGHKVYDILCISNGHRTGLTWMDGKTMNGKEEDFYIEGKL